MELIAKLLLGTVYSIVWGIVLFVVAFVILPEKIILKLIRKFKPDLVSKKIMLSRIRLIFDYIFNQKDVVISSCGNEDEKEIEHELSLLMKEKRLLEGNLFFLDLLKNISSMLDFSVSHIGYGKSTVAEILDQSMNYLQYYAKQIENTPGSQNQGERVYQAADILRSQVNDTLSFLREKEGEDKLNIAQITLKQGTDHFDSFMKGEYESAKDQLVKINQLLAEKFMHYIEKED